MSIGSPVPPSKHRSAQITSCGYRTLAAGNASEALAIIDASGKIDLLLTDAMTPGSINGRQLAVEALHRRPSLEILYVLQTGSSNLTLADTNEEAANSQAPATRQSIAVSALSLANQSQQAVLQLLR
jgi:flagellin